MCWCYVCADEIVYETVLQKAHEIVAAITAVSLVDIRMLNFQVQFAGDG